MEAFDAALAEWNRALLIAAMAGVGGAILFFLVRSELLSCHRLALDVPIAVSSGLIALSILFLAYANYGMQSACADLSTDVAASGVRLTTLDTRNIGAECGPAILRDIENQAGAT